MRSKALFQAIVQYRLKVPVSALQRCRRLQIFKLIVFFSHFPSLASPAGRSMPWFPAAPDLLDSAQPLSWSSIFKPPKRKSTRRGAFSFVVRHEFMPLSLNSALERLMWRGIRAVNRCGIGRLSCCLRSCIGWSSSGGWRLGCCGAVSCSDLSCGRGC